ncbi:L,D-transpeptidase [Cohnella sp.]|uniref:L,D-transpeptidase n=1 Tax=Cohnella sp. TaxID=1883426 RepID=UPI0035658A99
MGKDSKESRIEEQIQHFYDNVPNVGDSLPLKDYLLKHEDSRMAWYLLGKEYEGQGDQSKAIYCYAQAGEIYEAFESKPAPILPDSSSKSKKKRALWKWALGIIIPLALVGLCVAAIQAFMPEESMQASSQSEFGETSSPFETSQTASGKPSILPANIIPPDRIAGASDSVEEGHSILGALLTIDPVSQPRLLVKAPALGKWNDWVKSGKLIASVTSEKESGTAGVNWYDPKWCNCKPEDGSANQKLVQSWKPIQEEKLVMRSAMIRYREQTGSWPSSPEAVAADYPNNTMSGWSDNMTPWFNELKAVLENKKDGKIPQMIQWPENTGPEFGHGTPSGAFSSLTEQPLSIIVDKEKHRLAVISGNVLLRNYEVGLGGDKTPEGSFVITEKVKNPNGKSNGVFGSRGMTLSDSQYAIHGTDEPNSMGKDESLGCVRMTKEDLEELYDLVSIGTPVTIAKGGLPIELRAPPERFRLKSTQNETNPQKIYNWLN